MLLAITSLNIHANEEMNPTPDKAMADSAYINNDFVSAIDMYETILKNDGESADLYYNLGNSYYKTENIAKAILNYEKPVCQTLRIVHFGSGLLLCYFE